MPRGLVPSKYPPKIGAELRGFLGTYKICSRLGGGQRGFTFLADAKSNTGKRIGKVVIKVPGLDLTRSADDIHARLNEIKADMEREINAWHRLQDSTEIRGSIADVLDQGSYPATIKGELSIVQFLVQDFINGKELQDWCQDKWGKRSRSKSAKPVFGGIPEVDIWFDVAKSIAEVVQVVHNQRVVHGDIWPTNIMMREVRGPRASPALIDFGQAWLLDRRFNQPGEDNYRYAYYAPERWAQEGRTWYAPADIYSVGGVFYFLATGLTPPGPYKERNQVGESAFDDPPQFKSNTELKDELVAGLLRRNPAIYAGNPGVADIIHYCMRPHADERAPHAGAIIDTMELFRSAFCGKDRRGSSVHASSAGLLRLAQRLEADNQVLESKTNHLFHKMVGRNIRFLRTQLQSMSTRLYNLTGDRDEIVNGLLTCLSSLRRGDQCLALTTPSFWQKQNFGANGRVLTMLKMAALNGVSIRWVIVLTEEESQRREIRTMLNAQRVAIRETQLEIFRNDGKCTPKINDKQIDGPGYFVGLCVVDKDEREKIVRAAGTFVVLNKKAARKNNYTLVAPAYSQRGGDIAIVRCWEDPTRWDNELRDNLKSFLDRSTSVLET